MYVQQSYFRDTQSLIDQLLNFHSENHVLTFYASLLIFRSSFYQSRFLRGNTISRWVDVSEFYNRDHCCSKDYFYKKFHILPSSIVIKNAILFSNEVKCHDVTYPKQVFCYFFFVKVSRRMSPVKQESKLFFEIKSETEFWGEK
jgi:hypothetical protein